MREEAQGGGAKHCSREEDVEIGLGRCLIFARGVIFFLRVMVEGEADTERGVRLEVCVSETCQR